MVESAYIMTSALPSDSERIADGLRRRDIELLHELVERYQRRLIRYFVFLSGRRDHVDDLVQETWLRVVERGRSYDGRSRFEPWLFAIARHLHIDRFRENRFVSLDSASENPEEQGQVGRDLVAAAQPSPFELAARSEDAAFLASAMGRMESIYREALLLRFQEEMSLEEISFTIGAPVPTISSRIRRGLQILRTQWEGATHVR